MVVEVTFPVLGQCVQRVLNNPETVFNLIIKRGRAEVNVSTLSTEQKNELVKVNTWLNYSVVEAPSRQGRDLSVCFDEDAVGCNVQGLRPA